MKHEPYESYYTQFVDDDEKKEYIIHAFATAIDSADDMISIRIGQLN